MHKETKCKLDLKDIMEEHSTSFLYGVRRMKLTKTVNATATTIIDIPQSPEKSSISFLATNTQKMETGATIRNIVSTNDLTSGPKMNLPWRKKICKRRNRDRLLNNSQEYKCNSYYDQR